LGVSLNAQVAHLSLVLLGRGLNVFESQQVVTSWRTEGHKKLMLQLLPEHFFQSSAWMRVYHSNGHGLLGDGFSCWREPAQLGFRAYALLTGWLPFTESFPLLSASSSMRRGAASLSRNSMVSAKQSFKNFNGFSKKST